MGVLLRGKLLCAGWEVWCFVPLDQRSFHFRAKEEVEKVSPVLENRSVWESSG